MTAYFRKNNATTPVIGVSGGVNWIRFGDNEAVAEVTSQKTIDILSDKARRRVGGISVITAEEYAEKKTIPVTPRKPVTSEDSLGKVRESPNPLSIGRKNRFQSSPPHAEAAAAAAGGDAAPRGSVISSSPTVGSLSGGEAVVEEPQ